MNPDIAKRLAKALRSGEYPQARGLLNRIKPFDGVNSEDIEARAGFCCLGVLSEIAVQDGICSRRVSEEDGEVYGYYGTEDEFADGNLSYAFPPDSVSDWAGLFANNIFFDLTDDPRSEGINSLFLEPWGGSRVIVDAVSLNDSLGFSFNDIADLLDAGKYLTTDQVEELRKKYQP